MSQDLLVAFDITTTITSDHDDCARIPALPRLKLVDDTIVGPLHKTKICGICLRDDPKKVSVLKGCRHQFCTKCIFKWLDSDHLRNCPTCRRPIKEGDRIGFEKYVRVVHSETEWPTEVKEPAEVEVDWRAGVVDPAERMASQKERLEKLIRNVAEMAQAGVYNPGVAARYINGYKADIERLYMVRF